MFRSATPLFRAPQRAALLVGAPIARLAPLRAFTTRCRPILPYAAVGSPSRTWRTQYSTDRQPSKPQNRIDEKAEKTIGGRTLEAHPELVSAQSSLRGAYENDPPAQAGGSQDGDILRGVKDDLNLVVETVALSSVPREAYTLGLAGTLPYLATSFSTLYLSWNLNTQWPTDSNFVNSFLVSHETAQHWLGLIEPVQLGYGAVIISFLGAIHWGLEFAEKKASQPRTNFRYGVGVLASVVAWPTIFLPIEWALTAQFMAFTSLYLVDARATVRGWTPSWYTTYRFVLTFIVGSAIVLSLIARAKVTAPGERMTTGAQLAETVHKVGTEGAQAYDEHWEKEEEKEKEKVRKEQEEEEKKKKEEEEKKRKEEAKKPKGKAKKKDKQGGKDAVSEEDEGNGEKDEEKDKKEDGDDNGGDDKDDGQTDDKQSDDKKGEDKQGDDKKGAKQKKEKKD